MDIINTIGMKNIKIPILIKEPAHFFIKWSPSDKRYRISASFKYLSTKYRLHINIIRDLDKIDSNNNNFKFLLSLIKSQSMEELDTNFTFKRYIDWDQRSEFYYVSRTYNESTHKILVFFSLDHWGLENYLDHFGKITGCKN